MLRAISRERALAAGRSAPCRVLWPPPQRARAHTLRRMLDTLRAHDSRSSGVEFRPSLDAHVQICFL
ncbi:uncharacterized [Tachysurus ichikawai]